MRIIQFKPVTTNRLLNIASADNEVYDVLMNKVFIRTYVAKLAVDETCEL